MDKRIVNTIKYTLLGAVVGVFVGWCFVIVFNLVYGSTGLFYPSRPEWVAQFPSVTIAFIVSTLLWMLMGIVCALASYWLFDADPWNMGLTATTFWHFLIIMLTMTGVSFAAGWYPISWASLGIFFVQFAILYLIIWFSMFMYYRSQIQELNQQLKK
ncbi:DUF3021 domain-containing protein [Alloscardovia criceti]|uniref:DUF3021 domain-containing protein n=1 Tax=Alloscardovia criceti TaxID=356828 RepID=UPI000381D91A|nr:DUF3021 domain-containing protein [Alloscardovia criceti]